MLLPKETRKLLSENRIHTASLLTLLPFSPVLSSSRYNCALSLSSSCSLLSSHFSPPLCSLFAPGCTLHGISQERVPKCCTLKEWWACVGPWKVCGPSSQTCSWMRLPQVAGEDIWHVWHKQCPMCQPIFAIHVFGVVWRQCAAKQPRWLVRASSRWNRPLLLGWEISRSASMKHRN